MEPTTDEGTRGVAFTDEVGGARGTVGGVDREGEGEEEKDAGLQNVSKPCAVCRGTVSAESVPVVVVVVEGLRVGGGTVVGIGTGARGVVCFGERHSSCQDAAMLIRCQ